VIDEAAQFPSVCQRQFRAGRTSRAFTMLELLIVVLAIGILATLVIPQFSKASQQSKQNSLKDVLQYLRTQIAVFKAQHQDVPPGYPEGDPMSRPSAITFAAQMIEHSDVMCRLSGPGAPAFQYGPYLGQVPVNPVNGLNTIEIVSNDASLPSPDGKTGWIYKPQTQEIIANLMGKDGSQTPYTSY
jgi:prepilin-type N-terminal cleavage/methylation domain-containing protein